MYERTTDNNVSSEKVGYNTSYGEANSKINVKSSSFLGKVYGYMSIALLITFAVAFGLSFAMSFVFSGGVSEAVQETVAIGMIIGLIVSAVGLLVLSFVINIMGATGHNIAVPGVLYSIFMGGLLSFTFFAITTEYENGGMLIASAFLITGLVLLVMNLISKAFKNMHWLAVVALGLLSGALLLGALAVILFLFFSYLGFLIWIVLAVDVIFFVAMMLLILYDVWRIQRIASKGIENKNLALFCSFMLYTDFIYIFLKILRVLLILFGRSKK